MYKANHVQSTAISYYYVQQISKVFGFPLKYLLSLNSQVKSDLARWKLVYEAKEQNKE